MNAVVVKHPGGPEVLTLEKRSIPAVKEGWSLIKVAGFGVNHSEIFTREGKSPSVHFPKVLGIELVGEVVESTCLNIPVGQRVVSIMGEMGRDFDGSYEEYALIPNDQIYPVDTRLDWVEMAAVPETFYTAYGIFESLQLKPDDQLLIRGASSGVGLSLLKLVKKLGARIQITGTTREEAKANQLIKEGFDRVLVTENANVLLEEEQYDKIADLVGVSAMADSFEHLKPFGILNITGQLGGQWTVPNFEPIDDIPNNRYLTSFYSGDVSRERIQNLFSYLEEKHVDVRPAKVFRLEQIQQAHQWIEGENHLGKAVVMNRDFLDGDGHSRVE